MCASACLVEAAGPEARCAGAEAAAGRGCRLRCNDAARARPAAGARLRGSCALLLLRHLRRQQAVPGEPQHHKVSMHKMQ